MFDILGSHRPQCCSHAPSIELCRAAVWAQAVSSRSSTFYTIFYIPYYTNYIL